MGTHIYVSLSKLNERSKQLQNGRSIIRTIENKNVPLELKLHRYSGYVLSLFISGNEK